MSTERSAQHAYRYSFVIEKNSRYMVMSTNNENDVIPLFPDQEDDSAKAGWDPYIFSILAGRDRSHREERRRIPRPLTATRRRALLLASRKKKPSKK